MSVLADPVLLLPPVAVPPAAGAPPVRPAGLFRLDVRAISGPVLCGAFQTVGRAPEVGMGCSPILGQISG